MNQQDFTQTLEGLVNQFEENGYTYESRFDERLSALIKNRPDILTNEAYLNIMFLMIKKAQAERNVSLEEYCGIYAGLVIACTKNPDLPRPKDLVFENFTFSEGLLASMDEAAQVGIRNLKTQRNRSLFTSLVFSIGLSVLAIFALKLDPIIAIGISVLYLIFDLITLGKRSQTLYIKRYTEEFKSVIDPDLRAFNQIVRIKMK